MNSRTWIIIHVYYTHSKHEKKKRKRKGSSIGSGIATMMRRSGQCLRRFHHKEWWSALVTGEEEEFCRAERETFTVAIPDVGVASRWSRWWRVVELVAEKLVERRLEVVREKEQREMSVGKKNRWGRLVFHQLLARISLFSVHGIHPYL